MPINTDSYSRFASTPVILYDGGDGPQEMYAKWQRPKALTRDLADSEIQRYVVPKAFEGRPDMIANAVYGVSELDWLVIAYNEAAQVFSWPKAGQVIKLPRSTFVASELL